MNFYSTKYVLYCIVSSYQRIIVSTYHCIIVLFYKFIIVSMYHCRRRRPRSDSFAFILIIPSPPSVIVSLYQIYMYQSFTSQHQGFSVDHPQIPVISQVNQPQTMLLLLLLLLLLILLLLLLLLLFV